MSNNNNNNNAQISDDDSGKIKMGYYKCIYSIIGTKIKCSY